MGAEGFANPFHHLGGLYAEFDITEQVPSALVEPGRDHPKREGADRPKFDTVRGRAGALGQPRGYAVDHVAEAFRVVQPQQVHPVRTGKIKMRNVVCALHLGEHGGGVFEQRLAVVARQPVAQATMMRKNIQDRLQRVRVLVYRVIIKIDCRHPQMDTADPDAAMRELIDADNRHNLGNQDCSDQRQKKVQPESPCLLTGSRKARFRIIGSGRRVVHAANRRFTGRKLAHSLLIIRPVEVG